MLRPSALRSVLDQVNTGGIISTLLFNKEGSLLSYTHASDETAKLQAAVTSSIWSAYEQSARLAFCDQTQQKNVTSSVEGRLAGGELFLKLLLVECEFGLIGMAAVPHSDFVVCTLADPNCEIGLIRKKVVLISQSLQQPIYNACHAH